MRGTRPAGTPTGIHLVGTLPSSQGMGLGMGAPVMTPPREDRRVIVGDMAQRGISTRAIAPVVGVHHDTVARDVRSVVGTTDVPRTVNGIDGRTRTFQPRSADREARTPPSTKCCQNGITVIASPGAPGPGA